MNREERRHWRAMKALWGLQLRARLQSWQLSPHACNTGADQGYLRVKLTMAARRLAARPPVVPPRLGCGASGVTLHSRETFSFRLRGLCPDVIDDLVCNPTQRRVRLGGRESAQGARRV